MIRRGACARIGPSFRVISVPPNPVRGVEPTHHPRWVLIVWDKLIQNNGTSSRSEYPRGFTDAFYRVWNHRQDQVQDNQIKGGVGKRQRLAIHNMGTHHPSQPLRTFP